jgi:hypothetical protein
METMILVLRIEIWCFLIGLVVIVFYGMLTGTINTTGLLHDKGTSSGFSPGRLQLLIATIVVAFYYIGQAFTKDGGQFPVIPNEMLLILGGSHTFYLGAKTIALLRETFGSSKEPDPKTVKETNSNGNS